MLVLGRSFYKWHTKKVAAGCVRQVIILYSNNHMGICFGGFSIGHLRQVVILQRWWFEQAWLWKQQEFSKQKKVCWGGVDWEDINEKYENICKTTVLNLPKQTGSEEYAHSGDLFIRERIGSGSNLENQGSVQYWLKRTSKISPTPTQSFLKTCHHCPCFILKEGKITSLSWKNIKMCHLRHRLRIFLFHQKVIFHSYDIQVFLFLNI